MKIQSAQYLPVSVEVGRVNTEKYGRLIQTFFLPMYFNENFCTLRFFTLRCKQTLTSHSLLYFPTWNFATSLLSWEYERVVHTSGCSKHWEAQDVLSYRPNLTRNDQNKRPVYRSK